MRFDREGLLCKLAELGIETTTVDHPALFTVHDSQLLRGEIAGAHTKNLFVKDRKNRYFLLVVEENAVVDLKTVHQIIGAQGKVSFGKPEALMELLGVEPGSVTILGAINDCDNKVTIVLDSDLAKQLVINAHPLTNEATTTIAVSDLLAFLDAIGHKPQVLKISA